MPWHLDGTSALRESSWPAGQAAFLMHTLSEAQGVLCITPLLAPAGSEDHVGSLGVYPHLALMRSPPSSPLPE